MARCVTGVNRAVAANRNTTKLTSGAAEVGIQGDTTGRDTFDSTIDMSDIEVIDFINGERRDQSTDCGRINRGNKSARGIIFGDTSGALICNEHVILAIKHDTDWTADAIRNVSRYNSIGEVQLANSIIAEVSDVEITIAGRGDGGRGVKGGETL